MGADTHLKGRPLVNTATAQPAEEVRVVLLCDDVSGCKENEVHIADILQTLDYLTQEVEVIFHVWLVHAYSAYVA